VALLVIASLVGAVACTATTDLNGLSIGSVPEAPTDGALPDSSVANVPDSALRPVEDGAARDSGGDGGVATMGSCGDGTIDPSEECDPGATSSAACVSCKVVCSGSFEHEDAITHHCYLYDGSVLRWNDAQASCKAWGGDLAAVGSGPEYSFMLSFVSKATWIGANDVAVEGTFMWTTQEPFVFTSWDTGDPQDTNHSVNCVSIGSALTWQDRPCGSTQCSVCERAPLGKR